MSDLLDDVDQKIVRMRDAVPQAEIAFVLGLSEDAVKTRIRRMAQRGVIAAFAPGAGPKRRVEKTPRSCLSCSVTFYAVERKAIRRICERCRDLI